MKDPIYLDVELPSGEHKYIVTTPLDKETWAGLALRNLQKFLPIEEIKEGSYESYTIHDFFGDRSEVRRCKIYGSELISAIKSVVHIDYVNPSAGSYIQ